MRNKKARGDGHPNRLVYLNSEYTTDSGGGKWVAGAAAVSASVVRSVFVTETLLLFFEGFAET